MEKAAMALIGLFMLLCLPSMAHTRKGTATYYTPPYVPSACNGFSGRGEMIAAASIALWDDGKICGQRLRVQCTTGTNSGVAVPCRAGKSVDVIVTDLCPPPRCRGTIDLSQEAFGAIADLREGRINVEYTLS